MPAEPPENPQGPVDFGRSFLRFSTTRVNHTPRLLLEGTCTILSGDGRSTSYVMTCTCIAEAMYLESGLIHSPVAEFRLIASPRSELLMIKTHADAQHDQHSAHAFGESMPTHDGKGARVVELDATIRRASNWHAVRDYAGFRDALLNDLPMVGRTRYKDAANGDTVILEYPCHTVNVAHDMEAWQVDAGPILIADGKPSGPLAVTRLKPGYLVFNRFDYAEVTAQAVEPVGTGLTSHYGKPMPLQCESELYAIEV